ncbi:MAG: geranylgeranylglycerol-phosphate geranylgeranyltransferase [Crocinitomicaceae bacterium]
MNKIYQFLRLIRFLNIIVIAATMVIIQVFLARYLLLETNIYPKSKEIIPPDITWYDISNYLISKTFLLLLISTLLIAAAGNIINDYFDVRADRINKPERLIIGVHIKRRWAMVWHWSFNLIGFLIALYLGYLIQNIWIPIVTFLSINLLWFYSTYYKRQPFTGNLIVALLLGFIPVYILIYNIGLSSVFNDAEKFAILAESNYFFKVVLLTGVLAFLLNVIRELVKDILDVRGDLKLGAKTFPIKYGIKKTKYLIAGFYTLAMIFGGLFLYFIVDVLMGVMLTSVLFEGDYIQNLIYVEPFGWLLGSVLLLLTISAYLIFAKHKRAAYKLVSNLLKAAMLAGLLIPLFL